MVTKYLYRVSTRWFLVLLVFVSMLPFLDFRVLRMAGDEKVYITQALEMARSGHWFAQTLADEPSYFKGPLHYVLIRIGMLFFGNNIFAGTWMNAFFAIAAGLAMHALGRKRWNDKTGLLLGLATALNVGVISHSYVSQMEVELCAFYAFAVASLGLAPTRTNDEASNYRAFRYDLFFWVSAGIAGWSKSPLHSVLIGAGGLTFWAFTSQLKMRLKEPLAWVALFCGILFGILGYLPAYFLDKENFINFFILREQFQKANNRRAWHYVLTPLIHFLLPWSFLVFGGIGTLLSKKLKGTQDLLMLKLGAGMVLPTVLFWTTWTYKGQNYNLPTISALLLLGVACFNGAVPRITFRLAGILGALTFIVGIILVLHFRPLPDWWGTGWLILGFLGILGFTGTFLFSEDIRIIGVGTCSFFVAFAAFIIPLGEREMIDARAFISKNPNVQIYYYNLDPSIWSEWALLQLTLHHPVYGLHRENQLTEAMKPNHAIIVQNFELKNSLLSLWATKNGSNGSPPVAHAWKRWLTKGTTSQGQSRWRQAWTTNDLRPLERDFFIVHFQ